MHGSLVEVSGRRHWEDSLQMRWPLHGRLQLRHGEVADADHPHVAVTPGLRGRPLHQIVHVAAFGGVEEPEGTPRTPGTTHVRDHVDIAPRHPEIGDAGLDEPHRGTEILDLPRIRRGGDQGGKTALRIGPVHIGQQHGAIPHRDRNIVLPHRVVLRLTKIGVFTAGCLRPVELPLTLAQAGCFF